MRAWREEMDVLVNRTQSQVAESYSCHIMAIRLREFHSKIRSRVRVRRWKGKLKGNIYINFITIFVNNYLYYLFSFLCTHRKFNTTFAKAACFFTNVFYFIFSTSSLLFQCSTSSESSYIFAICFFWKSYRVNLLYYS